MRDSSIADEGAALYMLAHLSKHIAPVMNQCGRVLALHDDIEVIGRYDNFVHLYSVKHAAKSMRHQESEPAEVAVDVFTHSYITAELTRIQYDVPCVTSPLYGSHYIEYGRYDDDGELVFVYQHWHNRIISTDIKARST